MIGNYPETVIIFFALHAADKSVQKRGDESFRLCHIFIIHGVNGSSDAIAVHDFFHLRRRNKIGFLSVNFQETVAFIGTFYDPFDTQCFIVELLF